MKRKVSATTRLLHELFTQYQSTFLALCELLHNSIQADAKNIDINVDYVPVDQLFGTPITKIEIRDDGTGVHQNYIQERLLDFGDSTKRGGKGIGRFAALQIGSKVTIETVGFDNVNNTYSKVVIPFNEQYLKSVKKIEELEIDTEESILKSKAKTYYRVLIEEIYDQQKLGKDKKRKISERLMRPNLPDAIFERFPIILFNKTVKFKINGHLLKPQDFIDGEPVRIKLDYLDKKGSAYPLYFTFIRLQSTINEIRVFLTTKNEEVDQIIGGFYYEADWIDPASKGWFVYIHTEELNTDLYRNWDLEGLDNQGQDFKNFIKDQLNNFFKGKNKKYDDFIKKLHTDKFYPYKDPANATSKSKVVLFTRVAYLVEEKYNLFTVNKQLREIIYPLIDRTITTGELDNILKKILRLENRTVKQFNDVLGRVEIEDMIEFSERVSKKLQDIDFVEKITCSAVAKHVAERTELHKVIEKMLWIFGEQYLDNTRLLSDKNLENNLRTLAETHMKYKADPKSDNKSSETHPKVKSITDLFLYSEKPLDGVKREILVVELKAPKIKIGHTELAQATRYAQEIQKSAFYSEDMQVHIILISSEISTNAKYILDGVPKPRENPFFYHQSQDKGVIISVMRWAQVIEMNKRKLSYLSSKLKVKDVDIEEKINSDFNGIAFDRVRSTLRKAAVQE